MKVNLDPLYRTTRTNVSLKSMSILFEQDVPYID
jgi:hypothetical protein